MGIIKRIADIFSANAHAALDKMEDPAKMIDQYIRDAETTLGEVKAKTADAMVIAEKSKKKEENCEQKITELNAYAEQALAKGDEKEVEAFIAKRLSFEEQLVGYKQATETAEANVAKMREMHDSLVTELAAYKEKRDVLRSKLAVIDTAGKVTEITKLSSKADGMFSNFSRMEDRIDELMMKAVAIEKLEQPVDEVSQLKKKYDAEATNAKLQEAVKEFKASHK